MNELLNKLIEYGLKEREASLYLASLELGESGMSAIAKKAKIKRSTAYLTFKTLEERGLMGSFKMRFGLRFVATRPETFFTREERRLKELTFILPQLKELTITKSYKPKIMYYEGREGYRIAIEDSLKTPGITLRHIGSLKEAHKVMGEDYDFNHYMPTRIKNKIFLKGLYFNDVTERAKEWILPENEIKHLRKIYYLPEKYNHNTSTLIYNDRVIISGGSKELIVVVIESKEIAHSEQQKFDLIWDLIENQKKQQ
ncbi:MAG: helix-turn-helix domain-containing protein [bacterium]